MSSIGNLKSIFRNVGKIDNFFHGKSTIISLNGKKMLLLDHIAIIVSSEEGVEFYKNLGFEEKSREIRPANHDELIYLSNGLITLEIYKDSMHPKRVVNPEAYGLRHICFQTENIGEDFKTDEKGKFKFIYDPDGQPIEIREIRS